MTPGAYRKVLWLSGMALVVVPVMLPLTPAQADERWDYCTAPLAVPPAQWLPPQASGTSTVFNAAQVDIEASQTYRLEGQVSGVRENQFIEADKLVYDQATDFAKAQGSVRVEQDGRVIMAESAEFQLKENRGEMHHARFWFQEQHLRGEAQNLFLQNKANTLLKGVFLTSCESGQEAWSLKASEIHLDTAANEGVAKHARVEFMHVPVFYFPYLSFPLEGRKTGFLVPSFADSDDSGTEISIPYYWNLAPNRDATLTPRYMSKRGTLWQGEFRFLDEHHGGKVEAAYLGKDDVYGDKRTLLAVQHDSSPARGWRTQVRYGEVSDGNYLDDLSSDLSLSSTTHLEQRGQVDYVGSLWQSSLKVQAYQTLDETIPAAEKPYDRLPQLTIQSRQVSLPLAMKFQLAGEAVQFDHEVGETGKRFHLEPSLSLPLESAGAFFEPRLTYRYTHYDLLNEDTDTTRDATRHLTSTSLDGGLVFERPTALGGARVQTLEPRLFFLYTPYRKQDDLPVFDSSLVPVGFDQMYRSNRFVGVDRIGDAKQVSATLTTRWLDAYGRELASAALGRIYYYDDRRTGLPGSVTETASESAWLAELKNQWTTALSSRLYMAWDADVNEWSSARFDSSYKKDRKRVLNLGFNYEKDLLRQADVAFHWPIAPQWNLVARRYYSLRHDVNLETLAGLEFNSCCWAARIVRRSHRVDAASGSENASIWFQLELKGLTSVGRPVDSLLERDILSD